MSYVDKKFCFNCKLDIEQLQMLEKSLSNCSVCKIAQYCGRACQRQDFENHKFLCIEVFQRHRDLAAKAKKILDENGHDTSMRVLMEFYEKNGTIFQCLKKVGGAYLDDVFQKHPLEKGDFMDMGQIFQTYVNSKPLSVKILGEIARKNESYRGVQITLDAYFEVILALQPKRLYLRALVPLLMIQLGKDDEAYNFIKFWLKNTRKDFFFTVGEDGLFPQLPFTEITMQDQDKNEDLFQVLKVGSEKPYFLYFPFYVCLAIIKKNNYDKTKDENQNKQFVSCIKYIKTHYGSLFEDVLLLPCKMRMMNIPNGLRCKPRITASCGLQRGLFADLQEVEIFATDFIDNFMYDLEFYLDRVPELSYEMLMHYYTTE